MKMKTMNISLTPDLASYVRRTIEGQYGNASEFFRELVRDRIRKQAEEDLAFLQMTSAGALAGPSSNEIEEILATQRAVRRELKRERGL